MSRFRKANYAAGAFVTLSSLGLSFFASAAVAQEVTAQIDPTALGLTDAEAPRAFDREVEAPIYLWR